MEQLSFTSTQLLICFSAITVLLIGVIYSMRRVLAKKNIAALTQKHLHHLPTLNKYPEADAFKLYGTIWTASLAIALLSSILAFNWTTYDHVTDLSLEEAEPIEELLLNPPITAHQPPPPPPPPPPKIEPVEVDEIEETEEVVFLDPVLDIPESPPPPAVIAKVAPPPPPPPPPPIEAGPGDLFHVVEQAPRFPGCEEETGNNKAKKACADKALLQFIYQHIKYPAIARENGVHGTVVVQFVIEKDGTIKNAKVVRDIGAQCGTEALRVVQLMNAKGKVWTPGKQRGRPVRVQFNLPVKFRLE